jgi:Tfp pilus assembly major pilin PilA
VGKLKYNQKGFTAVEGLLIVLILVVIGAVGYMVYHNEHKTKIVNATSTSSNKPATSTKTTTATTTKQTSSAPSSTCPSITNAAQVPSGWQTYTSSKYSYSISYPSSWSVTNSGGSVDNLPILDGVLFTPPQNQGPQYNLYVTQQSLSSAISNWQNDVKTKNYNGGLSGGPTVTILSNTSCTYQGFPAAEIVTKQDDGSAGISYDIEVDVSANNYLYDFSTNYSWTSTTLSNSSDPSVGAVLSVVESLNIK